MEKKKKGAKFYKKDVEAWLADEDLNSQMIELKSINKKKHQFELTIGGEELKFAIRYPFKDGEKWKVVSEDLAPDFSKKATKAAAKKQHISEVLEICTSQFEKLEDDGDNEEFDDEAFDDGGGDEDDEWFAPEPVKKEKKEYEPEVDVSKFTIPSGYEASCVQAILGEYKNILKLTKEERGFDAEALGNNIAEWEIKLYDIPKDEELWRDMQSLGLDYITLRVVFPPNYPFYPPFLRVLRPRFAFRTGHVTVGGAICTHVLTNEGWVATYRLPQILVDVRAMMISGKGRLDKSNRSDYSEYEALDALRRLLQTHGWKHWKA